MDDIQIWPLAIKLKFPVKYIFVVMWLHKFVMLPLLTSKSCTEAEKHYCNLK